MNKNEWSHTYNKELAELYFYSMQFHNKDLAFGSIISWEKQYKEINSLFFCGDVFVPKSILGKDYKEIFINIEHLKLLEDKGLNNYPIIDFIVIAIQNKDLDLFSYLLEKDITKTNDYINDIHWYNYSFSNYDFIKKTIEFIPDNEKKLLFFSKFLIAAIFNNKYFDSLHTHMSESNIPYLEVIEYCQKYAEENMLNNAREDKKELTNKLLCLKLDFTLISPTKERKKQVKI